MHRKTVRGSCGLVRRSVWAKAPKSALKNSLPPVLMSLSLIPPMCILPALSNVYRSEDHTSELQSLMRISYAVFCLKKNIYPLLIFILFLFHFFHINFFFFYFFSFSFFFSYF